MRQAATRLLLEARALPFLARGLGLWLVLFLLIAALQWPHRHEPFYWDALGYVLPHAKDIQANHFSPILLRYDVGHPTAFPWLLAVAFAVLGDDPFSGHVLTWAFAALLGAGVFGLARAAGVQSVVAFGAIPLTLLHPLVWAQTGQIQLDLPTTASAVAALWAWVRERWGWYAVFGSLTALSKFHGFVVPGTLLCVEALFLVRNLPPGRAAARRLAQVAVPVGVLAVFLVLRAWIRWMALGLPWTALTVNYQQMVQMEPFWTRSAGEWGTFLGEALITSGHHWIWVPAAVLLGVGLLRRRLVPNRAVVGALACALAVVVALFPIKVILGRHIMLVAPVSAVLLLWAASVCWKSPRVPLILAGLLSGLFLLLWEGGRLEDWPRPLAVAIQPRPATAHYQLENDQRYRELLELMAWGAETVHQDSRDTDRPDPAVATAWPAVDLYRMEGNYGIAEPPLRSVYAGSWPAVVPGAADYVVAFIVGGFGFDWEPPPEWQGRAELVDSERAGFVRCRVYRLRKT